MSDDDHRMDRYLDGELSDQETAALFQWLESPENFQRFVERAELHADLRRSLKRRAIQENAGVQAVIVESQASSSALPADRSARSIGIAMISLAAAACLVIAFGLTRDRRQTEQAATVIGLVDGVLTRGDEDWGTAPMIPGDYTLQQGLLHLQFGGGVMVYVEAPARFTVVDSTRLVLGSGRVSANVPPEGVGFTVETPEAEVIDFGTEFSVDVEDGSSEVHVFDGLVRVQPRKGNESDAVDLRTAQAVKIKDATESPIDIELARDRFIRNFDEPKRKYARSIKKLLPRAFYRMPIRDRGMACEPPEHSGVVLTSKELPPAATSQRPPHARGVFTGGALRVLADSTGRGGRVDAPPELDTGRFSVTAFVYLETERRPGTVVSDRNAQQGSYSLVVGDDGLLRASINTESGWITVAGTSPLPEKTWRHIVVTADEQWLKLYEDGELVGQSPCNPIVPGKAPLWIGTGGDGTLIWDGRIDELALFDKTLPADSIVDLYETALDEVSRSQ